MNSLIIFSGVNSRSDTTNFAKFRSNKAQKIINKYFDKEFPICKKSTFWGIKHKRKKKLFKNSFAK